MVWYVFDSLLNKKLQLKKKKSIVNSRSWWNFIPFPDISYLSSILYNIHQEKKITCKLIPDLKKDSGLWLKKTLMHGEKKTLSFWAASSTAYCNKLWKPPLAVRWVCLIARRERHLEKEASLGGVVQIGYQTPKSDLLAICIYRVVLPKTWRLKEFSSSIGDHWHSTVKSPATAAPQLRYFIRKLAPARTSRSCDTLAVIIFNRDLNGITEKE